MVTWAKKTNLLKINQNFKILYLKDPGQLNQTRFHLGNFNRHTFARKKALALINNTHYTIITRDDFYPTKDFKKNIEAYIDSNFFQINYFFGVAKKNLLMLSNTSSNSSHFINSYVSKPFQLSDLFILAKNDLLKVVYKNINLISENMNNLDYDKSITLNNVSLKRKDLTPEIILGLSIKRYFKIKGKFDFNSYKNLIKKITFVDINHLGLVWISGYRVHSCVNGYLGRINPYNNYVYSYPKTKKLFVLIYYFNMLYFFNYKCLKFYLKSFIKNVSN